MRWPWRRTPARATTVPVQRVASWAQPALPPQPEQEEAPAVRLGFADGSLLDLPAEDPRARALRAVADSLVQDNTVGTHGSTRSARS